MRKPSSNVSWTIGDIKALANSAKTSLDLRTHDRGGYWLENEEKMGGTLA